jgi:transposase
VLAKRHQHVRRQRTGFHHKTALDLLRQYDTIYLEVLQVRTMSRRPAPQPQSDGSGSDGGYLHNGAGAKAGLNTSINDAGWYSFRLILACKAAYAGKRVEAVPPAYTSQDCSGYGKRVRKSLSVRTHVCPHCGLILDRDENAALNIHWRGQRLRGVPAVAGALNREPVGCSLCAVSDPIPSLRSSIRAQLWVPLPAAWRGAFARHFGDTRRSAWKDRAASGVRG